MELRNNTNELSEGYLLHWYAINSVIGRGGFGITYLAHDNNLDRFVAIKEFMPEDFAMRSENSKVLPKPGKKEKLYKWGLRRFVDEARTLAKFNHPNIIRVLSVFEENNTAYMVMEYAQGKDLSYAFKKDKKFTEEKYLDTFIPIMDGLALVHDAGFIHRDIKPANIYLCDNNAPLLLDFGSARQSIIGSENSKALTSLVTYGYAPFEQYNEGTGKEGPWTDIYSLAASIYNGITGKKPIDALARGGSFLENGTDIYKPLSVIAKGKFSDNFLLAVDNALMFKIEARPNNILLWADMLLGKADIPPLPDYMLKAAAGENSTVLPPWVTDGSTTLHTGGSKSSQRGLIDVHGKRHTSKSVLDTGSDRTVNPVLLDDLNSKELKIPINSLVANKGLWLFVSVGLIALSVVIAFLVGTFNSADDTSTDIVSTDSQQTKQTSKSRKATREERRKVNLREISRNKRITFLTRKAEREFAKENFAIGMEGNAYYYYQQILEIDADNQDAKDGILNIQNKLTSLANKAYEKNEFKKSRRYLAQLNRINGKPLISLEVKKKLALEQAEKIKQAKEKQRIQINAWLEQADVFRKNKNYIEPDGKNALELYRRVLAIEPDNKAAINGIDNIQQYYIIFFNTHLAASKLQAAENDLMAMQALSVSTPIINGMQKTLESYKKRKQEQALAQAQAKKAKAKKAAKPKPKPVVVKSIGIAEASKQVALFKEALQARNKRKIKDLSVFVSGREDFVDQLIQQYRKYAIQVTDLRLIPNDNEVLANIELADLVDINGNKVIPGNWSKFQITVRYDKKNNLNVYW